MIDNYRKKAIVLFDPTNHQIATRYAGFLKVYMYYVNMNYILKKYVQNLLEIMNNY
jgi:hypothetical protein